MNDNEERAITRLAVEEMELDLSSLETIIRDGMSHLAMLTVADGFNLFKSFVDVASNVVLAAWMRGWIIGHLGYQRAVDSIAESYRKKVTNDCSAANLSEDDQNWLNDIMGKLQ